MLKAGFFSLFFTLSYKERKAFRLFLDSPYFNRRSELLSLHDFLVDREGVQWTGDDKKRAYERLFPNKDYDDLHWRHTTSFFKKALEQFISLQHWEADINDQNWRLATSLRRRELIKQYEQALNKAFKQMERSDLRDPQYHLNQYRLYMEKYEYAHRVRRGGSMFLQEQTDALTKFYVSGILRQSCIIQSHQLINPKTYHQILLPSVLEEVKSQDLLEEPSIAIYYHSLMALKDEDNEEAFEKTTALIDAHWKAFPVNEIRDIYILAINYCIRKLNTGQRSFIRKAFDLYRQGIERKCLLDQGQLSPFTYKNVVMLGMSLGEHEWVEHFLHAYKKYLAPDTRENTFNYNLAIYYFRKPDYDQAMSLLQRVEFNDVLNNLDARRMLLRIYYEMGALSALDSHLDSFRQYISRQKELGYHRDAYLGLIKYVKKSLKARGKKERKELSEQIEAAPSFAEKKWLLEQLGGG